MLGKKRLIALVLISVIIAVALVGCTGGSRIKITFETNGGTPVSPIKVSADATELDLPIPVKKGFTFGGWYYDYGLNSPVNKGMIPEKDVTFYAKWTVQQIAVTFVYSQLSKQYVYVPYGQDLLVKDMPDPPYKEGYSSAWDTADLHNLTQPVTIYPVYNPLNYSVRYFTELPAEGETPTPYAEYIGKSGEQISVPADPTKAGYKFLGWKLSADEQEIVTELPTVIPDGYISYYAEFVAPTPSRAFAYTATATEVTVTGLSPEGQLLSAVYIPSEIDGLPVTAVGDGEHAFYSDRLKYLILSESVATIADNAFRDSNSLTEILLSDGQVTIGKSAFEACSALRSVRVASTVTVIDDRAFADTASLAVFEFDENPSLQTLGEAVFSDSALPAFRIPSSTSYIFDTKSFSGYNAKIFSDNENYAADGAVYTAGFATLIYMPLGMGDDPEFNENITAIGDDAFVGNDILVTVTIPASVTAIGDNAFDGCENLTAVAFEENSLLVSIGNYAFRNIGITSIILPAGLTDLGGHAFDGCTKLATVTLAGDELTAIEEYAFFRCAALTSINITKSVASIGEGAFCECTGLGSLTFDTASELTEIGDKAFFDCSSLTVVSLPNNLRTIGEEAFSGTSRLNTEPEIPNSVISIGAGAFKNTRVRAFSASSALVYLGESAFENCTALTRLRLPSGSSFNAIPERCFYGCTNLNAVTIPYNISTVGDYAFFGCTKLSVVTFSVNSSNEGVAELGNSCFENCTALVNGGDNARVLPATLTKLGERAYYGCTALTEITIPAGLATVAKEAFSHCTALGSVLYASGCITDTLDEECFAYCTALTEVELPSGLSLRVGDKGAVGNPFIGCSRLTALKINNNADLIADNGIIYIGGANRILYLYPAGKTGEFIVPADVIGIDDYAFYGCGISSLSFAHNYAQAGVEEISLVEIGQYAFARSSLTSAVLSRRVKAIGDYAFFDSRLTTLTIEATPVTDAVGSGYTVTGGPDNDLSVGKFSFGKSPLATVTLPQRTYLIDQGAFADCASLRSVSFSETGNDLRIASEAFRNDYSLRSISLPEHLSEIGDYAFADCYNLAEVVFAPALGALTVGDGAFKSCHYLYSIALPSSVTSLGEGVFFDCTYLTEIAMPDSVIGGQLAIPAQAFKGCQSLLSVTIPAYITEIGESAFERTNLREVTFADGAVPLQIAKHAFASTGSLINIRFPSRLTSIGEGAFLHSDLSGNVLFDDGEPVDIADYAFSSTGIGRLTVPDRMRLTGDYIFASNEFLSRVFYNQTAVSATGIGIFADCKYIGTFNYVTDSSDPNAEFDDGVCYGIGEGMFSGTNIGFLNIPAFGPDVNIGKNAFLNAQVLYWDLPYNADVVNIGEYAFAESNLEYFSLTADRLEIAKGAFSHSKLSWLYIDAAHLTLADGFAGCCDGLTEVDLTDGDGSYFSRNNVIYREHTLVQYPAGIPDSVFDLPADITEIASEAFVGNKYLSALTVRTSAPVTCGANAFDGTSPALRLYSAQDTLNNFLDWDIPASVLNVSLNELVLKLIGGDRYAVCGYTGAVGNLTIDGLVSDGTNSYRIEAIDKNAFLHNTILTDLTIGSGIKELGEYAFSGCTNLTTVTLSDNVTAIKPYAFFDCTHLATVNFGSGLTSLGAYSFAGCTALGSIALPASLDSVGAYAFSADTGLTEITFEEGLTEIGNGAFYGDSGLVKLQLPATLQKINDFAFRECNNLIYIYIASDAVPALKSSNALAGISSSLKIFVKPELLKSFVTDPYWRAYSDRILAHADGATDYVISYIGNGEYKLVCYLGTEAVLTLNPVLADGAVTEIGEYAFSHFQSEITLSEDIKTIAPYAFANATNLSVIRLPAGLETIGAYAFANSGVLQAIDIPAAAALTNIGDYAFFNCHSLDNIVLPKNLKYIGKYAFASDDDVFSPARTAISVLIDPTVGLEIAEGAFANNKNLEEISFDCAVKSIGQLAFANCTALRALYLNSIGSTTTAIPEAENASAFLKCDRLLVFIPREDIRQRYVTNWRNRYDRARLILKTNIAEGSFDYSDSHGHVDTILQDGFVVSALPNSDNLATIVNYLGSDTVVKFPSHVKIGDVIYQIDRLGRDENNTDTYRNGLIIGSQVTEIVIPSSVRTISGDAFRDSPSLTKVSCESIDSSLTTIGAYAFANCSALSTVILPDLLTTVGDHAFADCISLTDFSVSDARVEGVSSLTLSSYAFVGCISLASVDLPSQLTELGDYVFSHATDLTYVRFPASSKLSKIGRNAFEYTNLAKIAIPAATGAVGEYAFAYCNNLSSVSLARVTGSGYDKLTTTADNVFRGVSSPFVKVYVPENFYQQYRDAVGWSTKTVVPDLTAGEFNYRLNSAGETTVTLTAYLGTETDLVIPASVSANGITYRVTSIAPYFGNPYIKSLSFAENSLVTSLAEYAFAYCTSLEKVTLHRGIQTMGDGVFSDCVALQDVTLSSSLNSIPAYAFSGCSALTRISVPASAAAIGNAAFLNCSSLSRLEINFSTVSALGISALTGTSSSLIIIVPEGRAEVFSSEWGEYGSRVYDRSALYGDFVLRETEAGPVLVQYIGKAETLDLTTITFNGKHIVSVADNAIVNPTTTVISELN